MKLVHREGTLARVDGAVGQSDINTEAVPEIIRARDSKYNIKIKRGDSVDYVEIDKADLRWKLLEAGVWYPPEALLAATRKQRELAQKFGASSVRGRIVWEGPAPKLQRIPIPKDTEVFGESTLDDTLLIDGKSRGVANVFVYLKEAPEGYRKAENEQLEPVQFGLVGKSFKPRNMVVRTGQSIQYINRSAIATNIHSMPMKNSQSIVMVKAMDVSGVAGQTYKRAERIPVRIQSDFHAWLRAYQLPLDHPFGTVTDSAGRFTIQGLPPGEHTLSLWHETFGWLPELKVTIDEMPTAGGKLHSVRISAKTKVLSLERSIGFLTTRFGEGHPQVAAKKKELETWKSLVESGKQDESDVSKPR